MHVSFSKMMKNRHLLTEANVQACKLVPLQSSCRLPRISGVHLDDLRLAKPPLQLFPFHNAGMRNKIKLTINRLFRVIMLEFEIEKYSNVNTTSSLRTKQAMDTKTN